MTNFEKIKLMGIEEMANELKLIANWDRKEKAKAEQVEQFYINWLNTPTIVEKCRVMGTEYCENECPLCNLGPESTGTHLVDVSGLNSKFTKKDLKDYNLRDRSK